MSRLPQLFWLKEQQVESIDLLGFQPLQPILDATDEAELDREWLPVTHRFVAFREACMKVTTIAR